MPDPTQLPVTRAEFIRAWNGVREVARHVDDLKKAYAILLHRLEQLDRHVAELSRVVDEVNPKKVDA